MENRPLEQSLDYLKGVGPQRAGLLQKELNIYTVGDLLGHIPFRYVDKTKFHKIKEVQNEDEAVQLRGIVREMETLGEGKGKRLQAKFRDQTGMIKLVWFQGIAFMENNLKIGSEYIAYGKPQFFRDEASIVHPELDLVTPELVAENANATMEPVYHTTEVMKKRGLDSKGMRKIMQALFQKITVDYLPESLSSELVRKFKFITRFEAYKLLHFPATEAELHSARRRLKFEELFFMQLRLLQLRGKRDENTRGIQFLKVGDYFNHFYKNELPFELTDAQKKVMREIRRDLGNGKQMNRLIQGDVGSGKTVVALMAMLLALDNGCQACLMAPTEILARQHYEGISSLLKNSAVKIILLTGSTRTKARREALAGIASGEIKIAIGTHALIEDTVQFKYLGLAVIDEQHRFGVAQRASLWNKNANATDVETVAEKGIYPPHVLVMSATPIPRTLAMTLYGDLDVSVIDQLPPGRKPIETMHKYDTQRERVYGFIREEIEKGRQAYIVYPLIEENEKLDLASLIQGFEDVQSYFPMPKYQVSILHGKMKAVDKEFEMQRFVKGETQIMVATTVIEVGVNVPNASIMIVENTERFGLAQLHQLRGRVGRGAEQSYCILMSSFKLSQEGKFRIETMVRTTDGFQIAEADMTLRGAGNIEGTQQSGVISLKIADLTKDGEVLRVAREFAAEILADDLYLEKPENKPMQQYLESLSQQTRGWGKIS
jgi:ATP-dependent DNA helicase RecG